MKVMEHQEAKVMEHQEAVCGPAVDELFVKERYLTLVRLARNLVDDLSTAEDVVQEVCARMLRDRATTVGNPIAYARVAVVNECRSVLRTRKRRRIFGSTIELPDLVETRSQFVNPPADEAEELLRAVDGLPRRQREIVVLRYYENLSISDIANMLDITSHAVSASHLLAMRTLRTALQAQQRMEY